MSHDQPPRIPRTNQPRADEREYSNGDTIRERDRCDGMAGDGMRKWNLPLTYEPKIQPVIDGRCTQTIRALIDHKCKCKGADLGTWKHGESKHHSSGSKKVCPKCFGTGIIKAKPKRVGDLVRFYRWSGRPYWSSPVYITDYLPLNDVVNIKITREGISGLIVWSDTQRPILTDWYYLEYLATLDFIDPPTGEALRDVLMSKNKIPKEGIEAQILRWDPNAPKK